jgi:hypothetical protein
LTYVSGGDHDTDLFHSLGELLRLDEAVVVEVEVLEALEEHGFLGLAAAALLGELLDEFLLETKVSNALTWLSTIP